MEKIEINRTGLTAVNCDFSSKIVRVELVGSSDPILLKPDQLRRIFINHSCQIRIPGTNRFIGQADIRHITTYTNHDSQTTSPQFPVVVVPSPSDITS